MKSKICFIVFEGLSFGEKQKFDKKQQTQALNMLRFQYKCLQGVSTLLFPSCILPKVFLQGYKFQKLPSEEILVIVSDEIRQTFFVFCTTFSSNIHSFWSNIFRGQKSLPLFAKFLEKVSTACKNFEWLAHALSLYLFLVMKNLFQFCPNY